VVRLAELRRRQGRLVEAAELFDQAGSHGLAFLGRAQLAFDRDDAAGAAELAARYLRRVPSQNRTARAEGLELLVRALVATGDLPGARTAVAELSAIASLLATAPLRASASVAAGCLALGEGQSEQAQRHFEDAVDLFLKCGAPYELARARLDLARTLAARHRLEAAHDEAECAVELLKELRAEFEIARARALIATLGPLVDGGANARGPRTDAGLTKRELEVLRLVAAGDSNQEIGDKLSVSEHTIHRHIANIFNKLSVSSRAAAVAQAARRGLLT
jgi:ATP/maltotriose-dependent transcriptional regulator MalT